MLLENQYKRMMDSIFFNMIFLCILNAEIQGWMGPNYSISTACATSNFCILNAANHIIRGETVGGPNLVSPKHLYDIYVNSGFLSGTYCLFSMWY